MKASRVESPSKVCSHCQNVAVFKINYQDGSEAYSCRSDVGKLMGSTSGPYVVSLLEKQPAFIPVTLTLETQEEVDALIVLKSLPIEDYETLRDYGKQFAILSSTLDNLLKSAKQ